MIIVGNGIYERCWICDKLVKINKAVLGSLHFCLSEDERNLAVLRGVRPMKGGKGTP